jgi:hypothetical protein
MEKNKNAKNEMIEYMRKWHTGGTRAETLKNAEVFAGALAKTLKIMVVKAKREEPLALVFPMTSRREQIDLATTYITLAEKQMTDGDECVVAYLMRHKDDRNVLFSLGCLIGSVACAFNPSKLLDKAMADLENGVGDRDQVTFSIGVLSVFADCLRILDKFA